MQTALLILGNDTGPDSGGGYNRALHDIAIETLSPSHNILTTDIEGGWDIGEEIKKLLAADVVIYQYPVFWYMPPARLKDYLDTVLTHGVHYGSVQDNGMAGLLNGHYMLSTTWNAPAAHFNNPDTFFAGHTVYDTLISMRKTQEFVGLKEVPHFACHEVNSQTDIKPDLERYRAHLQVFCPT